MPGNKYLAAYLTLSKEDLMDSDQVYTEDYQYQIVHTGIQRIITELKLIDKIFSSED